MYTIFVVYCTKQVEKEEKKTFLYKYYPFPIPYIFLILNPNRFVFSLSLQTEKYGSTDYKFCAFKSDGISFAAFHIIFFSSSYLIPLTMISGLYAFMLRLWRTVVPHNRTNESHRGRKRVTRLVFVVVAAFALLWLPIQVSPQPNMHKHVLMHSICIIRITTYICVLMNLIELKLIRLNTDR